MKPSLWLIPAQWVKTLMVIIITLQALFQIIFKMEKLLIKKKSQWVSIIDWARLIKSRGVCRGNSLGFSFSLWLHLSPCKYPDAHWLKERPAHRSHFILSYLVLTPTSALVRFTRDPGFRTKPGTLSASCLELLWIPGDAKSLFLPWPGCLRGEQASRDASHGKGVLSPS